MGLDTNAQFNLVTAILKLQDIAVKERRDQIVAALGPIAVDVAYDPEAKAHVVNIVDTCAASWGGLAALERALRFYYGGAMALPSVLAAISAAQREATLPGAEVSGPTLDEMLELLQMECDRHHNMERFGFIYERQWKKNSPVVFVVPADENECAEEFLLRLVRKSLQEMEARHKRLAFSGAPPPLAYQELSFPYLKDASDFRKDYLEFLVAERRDKLVERYEHVRSTFVQQYPWYAVSTIVESDHWEAGTKSVEAGLKVFLDACIAHSRAYQAQMVFAFVLTHTREGDSTPSAEDRASLAKRVLQSRKVEHYTLPPLECVRRTDMETWLHECCKLVIPARDDRDFLFEEVFDSEQVRCLPMEELRKRFRDAFKAWRGVGVVPFDALGTAGIGSAGV